MRRAAQGSLRPTFVLGAALLLLVPTLLVRSQNVSAPAVAPVAASVSDGVDAQLTGAASNNSSLSVATIRALAPGATVTESELSSGGRTRGYLVIAPRSVTAPLPMIFVLHGVNASPTQEAQRDEFLPLASTGKAILVYPAGYEQSWNALAEGCCGGAATSHIDDLGFVADVVQAVRSTTAVSAAYLVGFSNGGKLAYQVMCSEPDLFDAVAVVGAGPLATCAATAPRSILIAVGDADTTLAAPGTRLTAAQVLQSAASVWRARDRCAPAAAITTIGVATTTTWTCGSGTKVVAIGYAGMTHQWPASFLVGSAVSGANEISAFFASQ